MSVIARSPFPKNELIIEQGKYIRQKFSDNSLTHPIRILVKGFHSYESILVKLDFHGVDIESLTWNFSDIDQTDPPQEIQQSTFFLKDNAELKLTEKLEVEVEVSVHSNDEEITSEKKQVIILPRIEIAADVKKQYSLVSQQNSFPLISNITIHNNSLDKLSNIFLKGSFDPPDIDPFEYHINELIKDQSINLKQNTISISPTALDSLNEEHLINLNFSVESDEGVLLEDKREIVLLPKHKWGGELHMPELLAAFVTPNYDYIDRLIKKSSNKLRKDGHESKLDGYQSKTRERPWMVAAALWSTICDESITYSEPPASFAESGQKIRLASNIASSKLGTCLDTALLFASCLEQAGLNCVIVLTKGHAMVGVWLIDEHFSEITNNDATDLRNRIDAQDLILFETTFVTSDRPISFKQSIKYARDKISEEYEKDFVYALDLSLARTKKIRPIDFHEQVKIADAEAAKKAALDLPTVPILPKIEERIKDDELTPVTRVERWQRELLDLSKRNKLLNIRSRSIGFKILCSDLPGFEDSLADGKTFEFLSKEHLQTTGRNEELHASSTGDHLTTDIIRESQNKGKLIGDCTDNELLKNLTGLYRKSKTDLEEGGSNTLFISLGLLKWKEDPRSDLDYRAPLILYPVKLTRRSAKSRYRLAKIPDEEPVFNLTLIQMLEEDHDINLSEFQTNLPEDESGIDVFKIWQIIRQKITGAPGFEVIEDIYISNFTFAKYLMWKDLTARLDDLKKSSFVNHLIEKPKELFPHPAEIIDPSNIDDKIKSEELLVPLNADSSQLAAIHASTKAQDFILEGPPGTGKSETIANIIAHNIGMGKKVLFVSEKIAALNVVYDRLNKCGLKALCLELHSHKANKKDVVKQLNSAWQFLSSKNSIDWVKSARELDEKRKDLNNYASELHKKSQWGYSAWDAISKRMLHDEVRFTLNWPHKPNLYPIKNENDLLNARQIVKDLGIHFSDIQEINLDHLRLVKSTSWTPLWAIELITKAEKLQRNIISLKDETESLYEILGIEFPSNVSKATFSTWYNTANIINESQNNSLRFCFESDFSKTKNDLSEYLKDKTSLHNQLDIEPSADLNISLDEILNYPTEDWKATIKNQTSKRSQYEANEKILSEILTLNISFCSEEKKSFNAEKESIELFGISANELFKLPLTNWTENRKEIDKKFIATKKIKRFFFQREVIKKGLPDIDDSLDTLINSRQQILDLQEKRLNQVIDRIEGIQKTAKLIKDKINRFENDGILDQWHISLQLLEQRIETIKISQQLIMEMAFQSGSAKEVVENLRTTLIDEAQYLQISKINQHYENLTDLNKELDSSYQEFAEISENQELDTISFNDLKNQLFALTEHKNYLNKWCNWIEIKNKALQLQLDDVVIALENNILDADPPKIGRQFDIAFCIWLSDILVSNSKILRKFNARQHNQLISEFRQLDKEIASTTSDYILAKHRSRKPEETQENQSKFSTLNHEATKKQRHKPIRQLLDELGPLAMELMPCFMMSPLSIAQYLPTDFSGFDLVVFDEASQITVWDAVGAIARGKNTIVVGDPKQMPPTNFFQKQTENDSDDEDLESILDQALATKVSHHRLTGHYRSRHESLIEFSNHKYYYSSLITYPAAREITNHPNKIDSAVYWHKTNGVWSTGRNRNNPIEASKLVDQVVKRLMNPELNNLSIGIIAMNVEQQTLIQNLLEDERRRNPQIEKFFHPSTVDEPIFVKNLETVQGDQRDIIYISVGYGPDTELASTMRMQFGPLGKSGGQRRLNVAITRAAEEVHIFTSFDPSMIDLSRTKAEAVADLKNYIEFADRGSIAIAERSEATYEDQFDSDFEESVATKLRNKGWNVATQIGVSKFRIDLGVIDPDAPGDYLAGIECDGATYHSSPSARDRDRIRQLILENLGWKILRIWSTDYFINRDDVIDNIHIELEKLLENKRTARAAEEERKKEEAIQREQEKKEEADKHIEEMVSDIEQTNTLNKPLFPKNMNNRYDKELHSSDLLKNILPIYQEYVGDPEPEPTKTNPRYIAKKLVKITEAEGPILVKKACDIYLRKAGIKKMGHNIAVIMRKAVMHAIEDEGLINITQSDEMIDIMDCYVKLHHQKNNALRSRGSRTIDQIYYEEIKAISDSIIRENKYEVGSESHYRKILELLELKRLTDHTQEILDKIFGNK